MSETSRLTPRKSSMVWAIFFVIVHADHFLVLLESLERICKGRSLLDKRAGTKLRDGRTPVFTPLTC